MLFFIVLPLIIAVIILEVIIMVQLDNLIAQVQATTTLEQSAILLIQGIAQQLIDAQADPAKIQELAETLKASADSLSAAVVANTPGGEIV